MVDTTLDALLEAVRTLTGLVDDSLSVQGFKSNGATRQDVKDLKNKLDALIKQRKGGPNDAPDE